MSATSDPQPSSRFLDRHTPPKIGTLVAIMSMSGLAINVFLPSLPKIVDHFDAPYRVVQLTVALYLASSAVLQVFIGPVSDKFGRRPVLIVGMVVFLLATLGILYAPTIEVLLICRVAQASIATGMALSRAAVRDMFPPDKAASMMGYVAMGMSMVPMFAPLLGGLLDESFGWRAPFWLLFGCGIVVLALTWADLGETTAPSGLSIARQFGEYPEILKSPRFWGYSLAAAFSAGAFFAYLGGAPYVAVEMFGMGPATFGFYNAAPALGYFLGNWVTGLAASRYGINRMVLAGSIIVLPGCLFSIGASLLGLSSPATFFGSMILVGIGNGMVIPTANTGMLSVRPHLAGTAAGLGGALMIGGGAVLSAVAGALLGPGRTELPLLVLMIGSAVLGILSILFVIRRERKLGLTLS